MGGRSEGLKTSDVVAVMRHMADVAALKVDPVAQRQLLIDGLNGLVGTDTSFFYVADEWRPHLRPHFVHQTLSSHPDEMFLRYAAEFGVSFPLDADPFCYASIRSDEPQRAWTAGELFRDGDAWRQHAGFVQVKTAARLADGMISHYRTGPRGDRIVGVGMHRFGKAPRLRAAEVALVRFAVGEVRRLVERGHLALPPVEGRPELPPRLKQVLDRLLLGEAPTRVARELRLSVWTVREHVQRLYRHYGVSSREELMARFVRG
jgi:DNA-binding CsgD family transcriptional regulator